MKRMKKLVCRIFAFALTMPLLLAGCTQAPVTPTSTQPGNTPTQQPTDPTQGNQITEAPRLSTLTVDGGYSLTFAADQLSYEIAIPAGRPRVPHIDAAAGSGVVTVTQAVLADGAEKGSAYAVVADAAGNSTEYCVTFKRDASLGFHLQYDDYFDFATAGAASYTSSDPSVLSVSGSGIVHAQKLSETAVTVKALAADGKELKVLTVDKVVKAPLNIFLITGQSNAYGTYDIPAGTSEQQFTAQQMALTTKPAPGTVLCTDVSNIGVILADMYDLSVGRKGFSPALGKTWYDLTGEKTLMIQTAVGGAPIEAWMKPENGVRNTYGHANANFYETTSFAYAHCVELINAADSGYELNRVHAYWLQGETGMASSFNPNKLGAGIGDWDFGNKNNLVGTQSYYDIFMKMVDNFQKDFGCEFMGILLVRAINEVCETESQKLQLLTDLVPARAAQYSLHNSNGANIALVSRVCDIARMSSWEDRTDKGWGLMGSGNLHYNQTGHNLNGVEAANNTYLMLYDREGRKAYDIEVIKANGRDRVEEGGTLEVIAGETYQTSAMVLPMYTNTPLITYEVADTSVCTIDRFGLITVNAAAAGKETTITYRCEAANLSKTIKVKVGQRIINEISYEWNFNKGDLTEKNGKNNLTVSEKTGNNAAYTIANGIYTSTNSLTNFAMEHPVRISTENDWRIEWRGVVTTNSALFGTAGNWTNFMYIAYSVPFEVENPLRLVGADGTALMIPYGSYAEYNTRGMATWKLEYTASTGRMTLYLNNTIPVGTISVPAGWYAEFTNLFGSYTSEVNVDYFGSIDWVKISTTEEHIVF